MTIRGVGALFQALALAPLAAAAPSWVPADFRQWAKTHGKVYRSEYAWQRAWETYRSNEAVIRELRGDEDSAVYGHTQFSDLSPLQFRESRFPAPMDAAEGKRGGVLFEVGQADPPAAVDWRTQGAVTPVKDQSSCGSCWAESAVGNIESQWFLANKATLKEPVALSVQQVIECDPHDDACYGGYPKGAYQYIIEHGGITSEAAYPYNVDGHVICLANQTFNKTCGDGMCDDPPLTNYCDQRCSDKASTHQPVARIASWVTLPADETKMAVYVAQNGPISIGLDASGGGLGPLFPWLQFYKRGVANPRWCTNQIDHGVLLVGYGVDGNQPYWLIKNSWGAKWGEAGYFRLIRGAGKCGVATLVTSAVVKSDVAAISV